MSDRPEKERSELPEPEPVMLAGVRYEAVPWGKARGLAQNGGYVAAIDVDSGSEIWLLKVYDIVYDGEREDDKQDLFIAELSLDATGRLRVEDERGATYLVDLKERKVVSTPAGSV
jgi:hypothetical protein